MELTLLELFKLGGIFMWPLLLFSIATIFISVERAFYFIYHKLGVDDIKAKVSRLLANNDYAGAQEYLSTLIKRRLGARIILALVKRSADEPGKLSARHLKMSVIKRRTGARIRPTLVKRNAVEPEKVSERHLERAVETEAASCTNSLENGLNFLTALGSLSPLTGFLGTVSGMISAFKSIAEATEVNAQIVANGIYEALITTVFGLIIAIIAMISHSIWTFMVDKFTADVEKNCSQLITEIVEQHDA